jgi:predicted nucleic acid-binding Zn ribbon protein
MPVYDYECTNKECGNIVTDIKIPLNELDITEIYCTRCHNKMERTLNASPVIFKGSCWSRDGYSKGEKNA